jgi:hypothetical protein
MKALRDDGLLLPHDETIRLLQQIGRCRASIEDGMGLPAYHGRSDRAEASFDVH